MHRMNCGILPSLTFINPPSRQVSLILCILNLIKSQDHPLEKIDHLFTYFYPFDQNKVTIKQYCQMLRFKITFYRYLYIYIIKCNVFLILKARRIHKTRKKKKKREKECQRRMDEKEKTMKAVEEKERKKWERNMGEMVTDAPSCSRAGVRILCVPLSAFAAKANCWITKIKEIFWWMVKVLK